ncbi:hypothetical protein COU56_01055 [Candidatus Pacearchaeota archaeon CG10_big_fil_rev_8_21_14_0_10_31_9]|nr:MAG: hypothetical protein COU56_01055 [Candidatus Pacearchaeota archaeon CG10_big_fil_rev_8_21_14_0_10_31_9]
MKISYDVLGNIIIAKFPENTKKSEKIKEARKLLAEKKSVETVLEKKEKVKGRLRTIKTNYLAGKKTKEALYLENNCRFRFNVETCYFSPRLSNERKEIYQQVKKNEKVLVMFGGVAPYAIVIAKNSSPEIVYSVELGRECEKYAKQNVLLNKTSFVRIIQGDVKKVIPKLYKDKIFFDRIVMPRPNLKESFLEQAFKVIKVNGIINYYGFSKEGEEILNVINEEANKSRKKIKIIRIKKAGDIAPYKFRWRVDLRVNN